MIQTKQIYTTGQVAQICNVAPRTVTKWFDTGKLKGYRIPGGRDRRIPASELIRFMRSYNIPTNAIEKAKLRILIIDSDKASADRLAEEINAENSYQAITANCGFDAGLLAQKFLPRAMLINLKSADLDADLICGRIRRNPDLQAVKIIAIAQNLSEDNLSGLRAKGYEACIADPANTKEVMRAIEESLTIIY